MNNIRRDMEDYLYYICQGYDSIESAILDNEDINEDMLQDIDEYIHEAEISSLYTSEEERTKDIEWMSHIRELVSKHY